MSVEQEMLSKYIKDVLHAGQSKKQAAYAAYLAIKRFSRHYGTPVKNIIRKKSDGGNPMIEWLDGPSEWGTEFSLNHPDLGHFETNRGNDLIFCSEIE